MATCWYVKDELNIILFVVQGWCPPVPIFRSLGVRTAAEIFQEKVALKQLRGDFEGTANSDAETLVKKASLHPESSYA